ncbi:YIP1 family protein [Haloarculaceae archaeon H-GB11]|nr:YIP1 family protein [Haloarculaceae archaeon H-GB11]
MMWSLRTLVSNPRSFFAVESSSPRRLQPAAVVGAAGLSTLLGSLLLISYSLFPEQESLAYALGRTVVEVPVRLLRGTIVSFGHIYVYWIVFVVVFYLLTTPFSGDGRTFDRREATTLLWLGGWGFLPVALSGLVWFAMMVVGTQVVAHPETVAETERFWQAVQQTPYVRATQYLNVGATVWAGYLWATSLATVRDVDLKIALASVLPAVLYLNRHLLL